MKHFLSNLDLHSETPQDYESIIFGAGCFWGVEKKFWQLDGVWLTSVGYSGGELEDPSYEIVCSCLLYTSPSPRDVEESRMPSSA